jgi:hypothetical protein
MAFLGMAGTLLPMLQGPLPASALPARPEKALEIVPPLLLALLVVLLGLYVPPPLATGLRQAAMALGAGP